jgi:2-polyprenyl-6-methoxyphenol hydroxylase-like FAD-dependent oxidoreductase
VSRVLRYHLGPLAQLLLAGRRIVVQPMQVDHYVPQFGPREEPMERGIGRHAVVVGAGIGGLTAASALSRHFERVTVLDRDTLPEGPEPRPGTPQARHTHVLLAGGQKALTEIFPEVEQDLERAGAVRVRVGLDIMVERPGYDPFPQRDLGFDTFCMSRPLLEFTVRRRLGQAGNITLRSRCRVAELVSTADRKKVTAVRCANAEGRAETIAADLVVDASGRAALTLAYLESIGAAKPDETQIGIDQAYSTSIFEIPTLASRGWKAILHLPTPPHSGRSAFIFPIEHNRWIVTLGGNHGDAPPGDIDGFMAFAKALRTATVYNAITSARRIGEITRFAMPASVRRHFDRLEQFPGGLIPIADSLCRFNPVFGQGMSVAAQEACLLSRLLASRNGIPGPPESLATAFFAEVQSLLEAPWATAVSDFVYPKTRGDRPQDLHKRLQYGGALTRLAAEDDSVHKIVAEVTHLIRPQSALSEPQLAARVTDLMQASSGNG